MAGPLEDLEAEEPLAPRLRRHNFDRLIMLSDGIFAVAFTLLALDLHPPGSWRSTAELWAQLRQPLVSYAISFAVIAAYWIAHRDTFARLRLVDGPILLLTLSLLFFVALLPAATQLLNAHGDVASFQVYGCCVVACGASQAGLWAYASFRPGRMVASVPTTYRQVRLVTALIVPGFFGWRVLAGSLLSTGATLWASVGVFAVMMALRRVVLPRLAAGAR